ncbi:hypothetical protein [Shinella sp.]|uniref:hypothetical protein n=1 Tax=Shinella sp. TaxID=1870904 RepID=UPI0028B04234|nr:hypothetical protein [Shinella sp.]
MNVGISSPQRQMTGADVTLECEHAIEGAVSELVDRIITAGWPPAATFRALKRATDQQAMAYEEDPDPADDAVEIRPRNGFSLAPF